VELIRRAAPLHDIGKIGIPDAILLKPGKLTGAEFATVKRHTTIGAKILSGSESSLLRLAERIALSHHERWDGNGYPHRLCGEQIALAGRIVAIADVFDALTHERPYKNAWPVDQAVAEVIAQRGRQFDPALVDAFARLDHSALLGPVSERELPVADSVRAHQSSMDRSGLASSVSS
jgi:putative two-component system response regulator